MRFMIHDGFLQVLNHPIERKNVSYGDLSGATIRMTGHFEQKWGNFAIQTEHIQIFVGLKPS